MSSSLLPFFSPRGVVVIGASTSPEKLGYGAARNLVESGYTGAIHFLAQRPGMLFGRPIHTDLREVPDPVDLAVLIVPPSAAAGALEACGERGIHAAILVTSGFREAGPEGAALEGECLETAHRYGIRLLGPNCIGIIDTHLPLDTTFLQPPMPAAGKIGFISHSGAFCAAVIDWARGTGLGFSRLVSLGNQADVNETDMLPILAGDENTRVISLYLEGVADGRSFVQTAREAARRKPLIALKVGRFEAGQKAAASHTGALAGSEAAFNAAFHKAGILRASTAEQMFDWARALEACPLPPGHRIAVLTNAGGPGVIAADALEAEGLELADLSPRTLDTLASALPPAASVRNPVDMLASASPEQYGFCLKTLIEDEGVDGVLVILPPPPVFEAESVARALFPLIQSSSKPILVSLMGSGLVQGAENLFRSEGIPTFPFPERAASALAALSRRAELLNEEVALPPDSSPIAHPASSISPIAPISPDDWIAAYGIPTAPIRPAQTKEDAASLARELGFPVVMKIASPDILHKSDIGGVVLDLKNEAQVLAAFEQMMETAVRLRPGARLEGVHLQRQILPGQDVIVGMVRDPLFGPLMMFGSGGIEVEGLKDVSFALAPLSEGEAHAMIRKTWAGKKLAGFRSILPADEDAAMDALVKLSCLALENPGIPDLEINPLRVLSTGAVALDVRMTHAKT